MLINEKSFFFKKSLSQLNIDLDFMDSSAGTDYFGIGINGDIFLKTPQPISFVANGIEELLVLDEKNKLKISKTLNQLNQQQKQQQNKQQQDQQVQQKQRQQRQRQATIKEIPLNENDIIETTKIPKLIFPDGIKTTKLTKNSTTNPNTLELIFSEITPNLILLQAHRYF